MRKLDKEYYTRTLRELRARLIPEVNRIAEAVHDSNQQAQTSHLPMHLADMAEEGVDREVDFLHNEQGILSQVEAALEKLERGDEFGICEECGDPIKEERLKAIPYTPHCIECASRLEAEQGPSR